MNVLVVAGKVLPLEDANANIVKNIVTALAQNGNAVSVLGISFRSGPRRFWEGQTEWYTIRKKKPSAYAHRMYPLFEKASRREKIYLYIRHWPYTVSVLYRKGMARLLPKRDTQKREIGAYTKQICKIVQEKQIDRIVAVTFPMTTLYAAIEANTGADVIWYQLDAFHSNELYGESNREYWIEQEANLYKQLKFSILPKLLYEENQTCALNVYRDKMKVGGFSNLRVIPSPETENEILADRQTIRLLFTGSFYEDIRNPEPLLAMIAAFEDPRIVLHIIGGGCEGIVADWQKRYPEKIIVHGTMPLHATLEAMTCADILVNVDNKMPNQLPSKLNDYMSTGKPILNLYPLKESAAAEHLARYPLCHNVFIEELSDAHILEEAERFCREQAGKQVEFQTVYQAYYDHTPEAFAALAVSD